MKAKDTSLGNNSVKITGFSVGNVSGEGTLNYGTIDDLAISTYSELTGTQTVSMGTKPANGAATSSVSAIGSNFTVAFSGWKQGETSVTGNFEASKEYTAIGTLTASTGYRFATGATAEISGSDNGTASNSQVTDDGSKLTFTYTCTTPAKPEYSGTAAGTPTLASKQGGKVTLNTVTVTGENVEYGYSSSSATAPAAWQDALVFDNVPAGTHYFFARVKESDTHAAGGMSTSGLEVTVFAKPSITGYSGSLDSLTIGTAITDITPTATVLAGLATTNPYAMTGTLPDGLSFSQTDGKISGTPTTYSATDGSVTIKVTDSEGITSDAYTLSFGAVAKKANNLTVTQADVDYNGSISPVNPTATTNGTEATFEYKLKGADDSTYTSDKPTAAGEYTVKATSTGHATVADATVTTDFKIKPITLTSADLETEGTTTKTYDGNTNAPTGLKVKVKSSSMKTGDTAFEVAGTLAYNDANVASANKITFTATGITDGNYRIEAGLTYEITSGVSITAADYTYTVATAQDFLVGGGLSAITVAPTSGTGVNSETVSGSVSWFTDSGCSTAANDSDLSGLSADDSKMLYWKFTTTNGNYTNAPKTGSTTFTAKNKTEVTISGLSAASDLVYDGNAKTGYTGTASFSPTWTGTLDVTYYLADGTTKTTTDDSGAEAEGKAPKNAGSYKVVLAIPESDPAYMGSETIEFTISPKNLTAADLEFTSTSTFTKVYDGNTSCTTVGVQVKSASLATSDSLDITGTAAYNSADVATANKITFTPTAIESGNYRLASTAVLEKTTDVSITRATLTSLNFTGVTVTKKYDGTVSAGTVGGSAITFTGKVGSEVVSITATAGEYAADAKDVGNGKTVTLTLSLAGTDSGNYKLDSYTQTFDSASITKADAPTGIETTQSIEHKYSVTGAQTAAFPSGLPSDKGTTTYAVSDVSNSNSVLTANPTVGEDGTVTYTLAGKSSYTADQTASFKVTATMANYESVTVTYTITLTNKDTVTISGLTYANKTYDGNAIAPTGTLAVSDNKVPVDQLEKLYEGTGGTSYNSAEAPKNAGSYKVTYKVADSNPNYTGEVSYTFTINKKPVTVQPKAFSITKGSAIPTFVLEYIGLVNGESLTPSETATFTCYESGTTSVSTSTSAGTYTITWTNKNSVTFTGADNYTVAKAETNTLTINNPSYSGGGSSTYAISVDKAQNGSITVSPKNASKGDTVTVTVAPDKGYTLETLTVLDKNGKEITVTAKDGKYTFKMPASKVSVKATFMEDNSMLNFFVDVPADAYYYDAVLWAAENGITGGVDAVHFAPNAACTRAQIVTFLWRAAGCPEPKALSTFSDVPADAYYAKAVAWAVENGITGGIGGNRFAPDTTCTRAQSVTFLYRAAGSPAVSDGAAFSDVNSEAYYANAVAWAAANDITGGIGGGLFGSDLECTRAQIVTFLYRSIVK